LDFTFNLVSLAFTFCLGVAGSLAGPFFDFAFACSAEPLTRSLSTIFYAPEASQENVSATRMFRTFISNHGRRGASQILHCCAANSGPAF
jgi:hypothetical protein